MLRRSSGGTGLLPALGTDPPRPSASASVAPKAVARAHSAQAQRLELSVKAVYSRMGCVYTGKPFGKGYFQTATKSMECEKTHIPSDLVVDRWAFRMARDSLLDLPFLYDVGRTICHKITSAISIS